MLTASDKATVLGSTLFKALPAQASDEMLREATMRSYGSGETVFLHGDKADAVYVVLDGWVKLYRVTQSGSEAVVSVFSKQQSFGEAVALRQAEYPVSAETVTECRLAKISSTALVNRIKQQPELALALVSATFLHLRDLVGQVERLKARSAAQRVAEFLLDLCPVESGSCNVTLPYDKVLIAGRLGMKPESLSRVFSKLRDLDVEIAKNHAAVGSVERLAAFCAQDRSDAWRS